MSYRRQTHSLSTSSNNPPELSDLSQDIQTPLRGVVTVRDFDQLDSSLPTKLAQEAPDTRATIRCKLTRLTREQFQDLSADVYDELLRLKSLYIIPTPHLPNRTDMHPKRNQARIKLSTLRESIHILVADVYWELVRRETAIKALLPDTPESGCSELPPAEAPTHGYGALNPI